MTDQLGFDEFAKLSEYLLIEAEGMPCMHYKPVAEVII